MKDRSHYPIRMIDSKNEHREDLAYWLSMSPGERISAMETLREQFYALQGYKEIPRLQRVIIIRKTK
ncbi:MAG TPA: hypothetical protein PKN50_04400 [Spirochaetota bacterium]|nr:hypothetical protein [Spirochaetota bacterium]HPV39753.1 hypothetical protein [Spirochaetota bacterium]